ncbi:MAG: endonuclease III [Clostridia bacterium]
MKKEEVIKIIEILKATYPDATCSLDFKTPFELGIAVMLSAQCTDERVNKITPILFEKYKKPEDYMKASLEEIEEIIKPCGFYKNKAKNVLGYAKMIVEKYNGKMPEKMEELIELPGIGRKSANVIMLEAFNNPQGIAVDTHAKRITNRIGISKEKEPLKVEQDLIKIIPKEYFKDVNHLLVWHGRKTCDARKPKCEICPVKEYCEFCRKILN